MFAQNKKIKKKSKAGESLACLTYVISFDIQSLV